MPFRGVPIITRSVDARAARGLGITPLGGLLVRPDGVPIASWSDAHSPTDPTAGASAAHVARPSVRTVARNGDRPLAISKPMLEKAPSRRPVFCEPPS